eukprot:221529-Rhodomonas_salina.1
MHAPSAVTARRTDIAPSDVHCCVLIKLDSRQAIKVCRRAGTRVVRRYKMGLPTGMAPMPPPSPAPGTAPAGHRNTRQSHTEPA